MNAPRLLTGLMLLVTSLAGFSRTVAEAVLASPRPERPWVRIGAAQPRSRLIPHRSSPAEALAQVDRSLSELERLIAQAAERGCDVLAFPEDTLGLGHWGAGHKPLLPGVLRDAVPRMLRCFGQAAASHGLYVVCCNDTAGEDGAIRNTAFLLGRDGQLLGRYDKVNMPIHELDRQCGTGFPVFSTPDLGGVGMLICYDMVFPEAARCLALGGADIIFHPTLGGAAIGDHDISRAAFRTRAVENFVYLVVAQRGQGSMIISPQGKILVEGEGPDDIAIADINPFAGREGGDAMNRQSDMRARLFRERSPAAFGLLTDPNPPVLSKVPATISIQEAVDISSKTLTVGEEQFQSAERLVREGKTEDAKAAFRALRREYRQTWIDRVAGERLAKLEAAPLIGGAQDSSRNREPSSSFLPARTTLSNPGLAFTVPDQPYVVLRRGPLQAVIVDNRGVDDAVLPGHRPGYHGVGSLTHERQRRNLFVPAYAGLNFEHIHDGTTRPREILFEPRHASMELRVISDTVAELYQPPTPHWGLESSLRYELLPDGVMEVTFECIPRKAAWKNNYLGLFWASYIDQPESLGLHFLQQRADGSKAWIHSLSPRHGLRAAHRAPGDEREFAHDPDFPLTLVFNFSDYRYAEPWSFGECRGMALAQIFRRKDGVRLAQSPSGGGEGNPAWDFQWFIPGPQVGRRYQLVMRVLYTPVAEGGPEAVRENVQRQIERAGPPFFSEGP